MRIASLIWIAAFARLEGKRGKLAAQRRFQPVTVHTLKRGLGNALR